MLITVLVVLQNLASCGLAALMGLEPLAGMCAGSIFVDFINAGMITVFLNLFG